MSVQEEGLSNLREDRLNRFVDKGTNQETIVSNDYNCVM